MVKFMSDSKTVASFGAEWEKFNEFTENELEVCGKEYFDLIGSDVLNQNTLALDVGCGSGRWTRYLSKYVKFIEAIDPSSAFLVARDMLKSVGISNARVTQASVEAIPFDDDSFDFVFSLGVLHHIPQTEDGIVQCVKKLKRGGWFLIYLYYNLENRSSLHRILLRIVTGFRWIISRMPQPVKEFICEFIAAVIYWPLAFSSRIAERQGLSERLIENIPLSAYRNKTFKIMRNDALDRFGTPLEKRFSKAEIRLMLERAGLGNIRFSEKAPYWHAVAQKI